MAQNQKPNVSINSLAIARTKAAEERPYLAAALWSMVPVPKKGIGTLGCDEHWRVYFDPELDWQPEHLSGVLQHEVWHLLRDHHARGKGLDPKGWNIAGDMEINDDLVAEGIKLPIQPVLPQLIKAPNGLLAEQYYDMLPRSKNADGSQGERGGGMADPKCGSCACDKANDFEDPAPGENGKDGKEAPPGISPAERDLLTRQVAHEIVEASKTRGNIPADMVRWAKEILNPKIDWQKELKSQLRRAIEEVRGQNDYAYGRISKRQVLYPEVILPSLVDPVVRPAVVVDTSGSMSDHQLQACLGEVQGCIQAVGYADIPVISCDMVASIQERVTSAKRVTLRGGGGTDMGVGIEAATSLRSKPNVIVVLTDGYTGWPPESPKGIQIIVGIVRSKGDNFENAGVPDYARQVNIEVE